MPNGVRVIALERVRDYTMVAAEKAIHKLTVTRAWRRDTPDEYRMILQKHFILHAYSVLQFGLHQLRCQLSW